MTVVIPVSRADSRFSFRVLAIDLEMKLFVLGESEPRFDAELGQDMPRDFPLDRSLTYVVRYDNNDGGAGELHFQVIEARTHEISRHEMNLASIHSPHVIEIQFSFRVDPSIPQPG